jgi:hypothetical protein
MDSVSVLVLWVASVGIFMICQLTVIIALNKIAKILEKQ